MAPVELVVVAIVAGLLLLATSRWSARQRAELERLEPPASLVSRRTWEEEVLAAQVTADQPQASQEQAGPQAAGDPPDRADRTDRPSY